MCELMNFGWPGNRFLTSIELKQCDDRNLNYPLSIINRVLFLWYHKLGGFKSAQRQIMSEFGVYSAHMSHERVLIWVIRLWLAPVYWWSLSLYLSFPSLSSTLEPSIRAPKEWRKRNWFESFYNLCCDYKLVQCELGRRRRAKEWWFVKACSVLMVSEATRCSWTMLNYGNFINTTNENDGSSNLQNVATKSAVKKLDYDFN